MVKKKAPTDINLLAKFIVEETTKEPTPEESTPKEKNPAAVALGRLGGLKGGIARKKALSAERRKQIAKKAANSRWNKEK